MLTKKYNKKLINKKNKSKKNKFKKIKKNLKISIKSKKIVKINQKNKKIKTEGEEIINVHDKLNYIISSSHGMIFRNTSDINDPFKNPMITIPKNMNLITYTDFCSRSCSNVKTMINFICNSDNSVGSFDKAHKEYASDSIIPEIYLTGYEGNDSIKIDKCNSNNISNVYINNNYNKFDKLSKLIEIIKKDVNENEIEKNINIHFIPCLEVYDISKLANIDINNNIPSLIMNKLNNSNSLKNCSEDILKIKQSIGSSELTPNTIKAVIDISGIKKNLELKFQDNVKSEDKHGIYPAIIQQLNNLFKYHQIKDNKIFINWLVNKYKINSDLKIIDISQYKSILELISRISSVIVLEQQDKSLFENILSGIPNAINNNNNILIDMSGIDISDKEKAEIIKKYLFKILKNKINPITEDRAINKKIEEFEQEKHKDQKKLEKAKLRYDEYMKTHNNLNEL